MKKLKTVLIDLDRLKNPHNGLGQFALKFGEYISKENHKDLKFTFLVPKPYVGYFGQNVDYEITDWKRRYFPNFLKSYDLWHAIHQDSNFYPNFNKTLYLLTIHDLNFLKEKSPIKAQKRLKHLQKKVNKAVTVTTISYYSKNEIEQHLKLSKPVEVIYNGIEVQEPQNLIKQYDFVNQKFLLGIGVIQPKKNWHVLVEMMKFLPEKFILVLAGENQTKYAKYIHQLIDNHKLNDRIYLIGKITEEEKFFLLKNCEAFVFPSKYEGMGMPPLEAMSLGKPVFVFPHSSIPEFCKQYAFYWNSENPEPMAELILNGIEYFYNQNLLLPQKMMDYIRQFTWKNTVQQYLQLYKKVLNL